MRPFAILLFLIASTASAQQPRPPVAVVDARGLVVVALDRTLLDVREVNRQLMSGLTASFIVRMERHDDHGRIEVRYEPWDEVFHVRSIGSEGSVERLILKSRAELDRWWGQPRLTIGRLAGAATRRIIVEVIPFSASEEADAKEWLARSVGTTVAEPPAETPAAPSLFSAVISSSIRRKPVVRYGWTVAIQRKPS
jgi:hypothetical protein